VVVWKSCSKSPPVDNEALVTTVLVHAPLQLYISSAEYISCKEDFALGVLKDMFMVQGPTTTLIVFMPLLLRCFLVGAS
jgi:hypothetical protein